MAVEEPLPNKGDPNSWAILSEEETRCLLGLKKYYELFEDKPEEANPEHAPIERAWKDIQREFKRLQKFKWYK